MYIPESEIVTIQLSGTWIKGISKLLVFCYTYEYNILKYQRISEKADHELKAHLVPL